MSIIQRTSDAIERIVTNTIKGQAAVVYTSGHAYVYDNVSRLALLNLKAQPNMSLGFWVNHNCANKPVIFDYKFAPTR